MSVMMGFILLGSISIIMMRYELHTLNMIRSERHAAGLNVKVIEYTLFEANQNIAKYLTVMALIQVIKINIDAHCAISFPSMHYLNVTYVVVCALTGIIIARRTLTWLKRHNRIGTDHRILSWHLILYHTIFVCNILLVLNSM